MKPKTTLAFGLLVQWIQNSPGQVAVGAKFQLPLVCLLQDYHNPTKHHVLSNKVLHKVYIFILAQMRLCQIKMHNYLVNTGLLIQK